MTLMDIDSEYMSIPEDDRSVQFNMDSKMFSSLVKQLIMFDEVLHISCNEDKVKFYSKGLEGSMSVDLFDNEKEYVNEYMIDEDYELKISFALRYFEHFCAFTKVSPNVRLSFSNDFPVEIYYSLECDKVKKPADDGNDDGDVEENKPLSFLRFFLAPKIHDDDGDDGDDGDD